MSRRKEIIFVATGLVVGALTATLGYRYLAVLEVGVGPLFFAAILAATALSGSWPQLKRGAWRYLVAAGVSTAAYIVALMVFWGMAGYSPQIFGVKESHEIGGFGADMCIGLLSAAIVAATLLELVICILIGRWSNKMLEGVPVVVEGLVAAADFILRYFLLRRLRC